jgi:16S rRNA (cytidine1402-2'-O)-methyltransferase
MVFNESRIGYYNFSITGNAIMSQEGLYVVATPIGNLEDISYRAVRILSEVDYIAAEDTRHSRALLSRHGISTQMMAFHEHNEDRMTGQLLKLIAEGTSVAIISDAGTPLISDPGYRLVLSAREADLPVFTLPGPSAVTAALSVAGLPTDRFVFEGFLPSKDGARTRKLESLAHETRTLVFFESKHRIEVTIATLANIFGEDRICAVCRELTKKFETVLRASLGDLKHRLGLDQNQLRGEFVLVVAGREHDEAEGLIKARKMFTALSEYLPASKAARVAAKLNNVPRREVYRTVQK